MPSRLRDLVIEEGQRKILLIPAVLEPLSQLLHQGVDDRQRHHRFWLLPPATMNFQPHYPIRPLLFVNLWSNLVFLFHLTLTSGIQPVSL